MAETPPPERDDTPTAGPADAQAGPFPESRAGAPADLPAGDGTGPRPGRGRRRTGTSADALPDVEGEDGEAGPAWRRIAAARWGETPLAAAVGAVVLVLAAALTLFQLYIALRAGFDARQQRLIHLMFIMVLVFLVKPPLKGSAGRSVPALVLDLALIAGTVAVSFYPMVFQAELASRAGAYTDTDWIMGLAAMLLLLEATRRTVGMVMVVMVAVFVFYAWIGPLVPGQFGHSGATIQRIATHSYLGDGIYGMTLGVVVTFVFVFILFGALLSKTGGGSFFVGLAYVLTGRMVGGPAKGAVLGSALMGSVSGSAIANVVSTGPFTIPLMKKVGYRKHDAAGVEAAASTGGQILPPIMGAGAFIMAERTGIPYADIVKVAIIPALMYFGVMFLFVDILARKYGIGLAKDSDLPSLGTVMKAGWHFLAPLVLLVVLLLQYVPPTRAGLYACGALLVVAMLRAGSRLSPRDFLEVFVLAANSTLSVSVACAVAGIIVGMVGLTGLGLVFSDVLVTAFAGSLLLTLLMVALASLVMGIGLPVTASYVVLAVLAVPALEELGLAVIVAHMIVYWYSQDSNVTPPVAFAAFAAAGIANASPMRSGLSAWKFAKGLYLIPVLMAYSALMAVEGPVSNLVVAVLSGCIALAVAAMALEGHFLRRTLLGERLALTLAATLVMIAPEWSALTGAVLSVSVDPDWFVLAGSVLGVVLIALQVVNHRRDKARGAVPAPDAPGGGGAPEAEPVPGGGGAEGSAGRAGAPASG
ncbi:MULTISPECIES: TRAP transporter permease [Nocardiopsidaceae]|uniref:TRAP transporter fused permease subunit n=1 Tax=Streptomonospora nanhaiensis TaxID=1323731 RepID=A0ABY6YQT5_9ACTN|nr:TRAP transporter fused permease subunit [Streptomonospora nanhaiensis]WAE74321.1 TRAP transporter fused permease subunit [Streptomonospora nanhaiensis]